MKERLVTVILLAETSDDNSIIHVVKNIKSQTHKNIDLVISTFREVSEELKEKCRNITISGIRWVSQEPKSDFFKQLLEMADGEVIFYKTMNNIIWYPRHIEAHLEEIKNNNTKWGYSHVEYRDIDLGEHPYNAVSYRVTESPTPTKVSIDEICHLSSIETDWNKCLREDKQGNPYFVSGFVHEQWLEKNHRGSIPKEITLVNWVKVNKDSKNDAFENYKKTLGTPKILQPVEENKLVDGEIVIERKWPTMVGNSSFMEHNKTTMRLISQTESPEDIKSIAIKRTMGMGDVLLVEPIIRKLKQKYPNASLTLYTAKPDIVKYFDNKPDAVEIINDTELLTDYLSDKDETLRFDLDISYESRENVSFVDAYAEICGIEFDNQQDKHVSIDRSNIKNIESEKPVAVVCGDGSGWAGKTWPLSYYEEVIEHLQGLGYNVIETGHLPTTSTSEEYHGCDFDTMVSCLSSAEIYVGADNGPMHIARGLDVPCVIVAGAALPYYTNPNRKNIYYVEDSQSENYGIKHRFFIRKDGENLSFVPPDDVDPRCGLDNISPSMVINAIDKLLSQDKKFSFNMSGSIVRKDVIEGFAYFETDCGLVRENKFYHPDQRVDLSQYYEESTDQYFDDYLTDTFDFVVSNSNKDSKIIDVGCNMGILLNRLDKQGYTNLSGIDINTSSVKKGKITYPNISDKIEVQDCNVSESFGSGNEIIIFNDLISKLHDPVEVLQNANASLKENGKIFVSAELFDISYIDQKDERLSIGENIYIFDEESITRVFEKAGLVVDNRQDAKSGFINYILKRG